MEENKTFIQNDTDDVWIAVIGRSLAFLSLHVAELRDKELAVQAGFLEGLGLPRREAAKILGTSEDSLRVLQRRASTTKGAKGGAKKSTPRPRK